MTTVRTSRSRRAAVLPTDAWYAVAAGEAVGRSLLGRRAVGRPVVLFRREDGTAVALADRCVHRPYPLSAGLLEGDSVRCGLCGFVYDSQGRCLSVPTQPRVPLGAQVHAFPVREQQGLVWVWFGEPGRAPLHRVPDLDWLDSDGWVSVGGEQEVAAHFLLLHESFADVTKVPEIAPDVAPLVLREQLPRLEVVVTETTVALARDFPPGPLPSWQATALGRDAREVIAHRQEGHFISPAVWVDHWDVLPDDAPPARLRFTQLVTPVEASRTLLLWRVSRDFAIDEATTVVLAGLFGSYYARSLAAVEAMQQVIDQDGAGPQVNVNADVAALRIRDKVTALLAEQGAAPR